MAAVTITCSIIIITTGEAIMVKANQLRSNSQFNQYLCALYKIVGTFLFGAAVSQSLTDLAKFTIGRPRPNFLAVCNASVCNGYMPHINCTGNPRHVTESRLSFYSGHSSFGMYCMLFLSLYIQARLQGKWTRLVRPTIQFFLILFAVYVATPECQTTNTTGATCWWGCFRGRSSPSSLCDTCLTSSNSALLCALSPTHLKSNIWTVKPIRRRRKIKMDPTTTALYEPFILQQQRGRTKEA
ncbi:hypothetical protein WMY93_016622 [Mugilogobius chulae]|uniref:Phosphatidic acid phosphatase type 2/haloperoxidase domain-containing protein n=1 Tax=Mugilogobius chulae TaxID=88201 RepID=A0AAW0NW27_9GOBI